MNKSDFVEVGVDLFAYKFGEGIFPRLMRFVKDRKGDIVSIEVYRKNMFGPYGVNRARYSEFRGLATYLDLSIFYRWLRGIYEPNEHEQEWILNHVIPSIREEEGLKESFEEILEKYLQV